MMGDSSMGEAPEDLYHHMQVLSCENQQGSMARGLTFLESGLMTGSSTKFSSSWIQNTPFNSQQGSLIPTYHPVLVSIPYFTSRKSSFRPSCYYRLQWLRSSAKLASCLVVLMAKSQILFHVQPNRANTTVLLHVSFMGSPQCLPLVQSPAGSRIQYQLLGQSTSGRDCISQLALYQLYSTDHSEC